MKAISILGAIAMMMAADASFADHVYRNSAGRWRLNGYIDYADQSNNSCVFSTDWADGKRIQVNVFPKYDGSSNVTMTVLNPYWNNSSWDIGRRFETNMNFYSTRLGNQYKTGTAQTYLENKVIFRGMNKTFVNLFIRSATMTIFAGSSDELVVNLSGTAELSRMLSECRLAVLTDYVNTPGDNF